MDENHKSVPVRRSALLRLGGVLLAVFAALALTVGIALALFTNGSFESGDFTGWDQDQFRNPGLMGAEPFSGESISHAICADGYITCEMRSEVLGPYPLRSQCDITTNNQLCFPIFGEYVARVNGPPLTPGGRPNKNVNTLVQTDTVTADDVSPMDGQIHIVFAYAPVMEDPNHPAKYQAFFYVAVKNLSRGGALLFEEFVWANQPGVPWKVGYEQTPGQRPRMLYTDWQVKDIVPGAANIAIGDQVQIEVVASDCALGAHSGWVYTDVFGSSIPGLWVSKTGPATVESDSDLVYRFNYINGSAAETGTNVLIVENAPTRTTFIAADSPPCAAAVGGAVTCTIGTLYPGVTGTFQITVHVNAGFTGTVANGDYWIQGDDYAPLLGSLVNTPIEAAPVLTTDLAISKGFQLYQFSHITYTIVARNLGPAAANGAIVSDTMSTQIITSTWVCAGAGGAACTASGAGNIYDTVSSFPVGGVVTYTVSGLIKGWNASNTAEVLSPALIPDPVPSNNRASTGQYCIFIFPIIRESP
jgi:hypothetical protein